MCQGAKLAEEERFQDRPHSFYLKREEAFYLSEFPSLVTAANQISSPSPRRVFLCFKTLRNLAFCVWLALWH